MKNTETESVNDIKNLFERNNKILVESEHIYEYKDAIDSLFKLYTDLSPIDSDLFDMNSFPDYNLKSGVAISLGNAARCFKEYMRTPRFVQGVYQGVKDLVEEFGDEPINILYAGSGPFAPLVLPLTIYFNPEQLNFYILDICNESLDNVKTIVEKLGLENYFDKYICADATNYRFPDGEPLHMVISETMTRTLAKEPQVPITYNLVPQLTQGGILIPEEISVSLVLTNPKTEMEEMFFKQDQTSTPVKPINLACLLKISAKETLNQILDLRTRNNGVKVLLLDSVILPEVNYENYELELFTDITLYKDVKLTKRQCSLTYPHQLRNEVSLVPGNRVSCYYRLDNHPKICFEQL